MNNAVGATNNNSFHPTRNQIPIISFGVEVDIESLISYQATENICTYPWTWALRLYDAYNLTDN